MELRQLVQFQAVAETENLTKAAAKVFVSQPALTKTISRLEDELGVNLFDRKGKSLTLNEAGKVLLRYTNSILELQQQLTEELQVFSTHSKDTRILCGNVLFAEYMFPQYLLEHEDACISFDRAADCDIQSEMLLNRTCDIAITQHPLKGRDIVCRVLFEDEILVHVVKTSPLAALDLIHPIQLNNMCIAVGDRKTVKETGFFDDMERAGAHVAYQDLHGLNFYNRFMADSGFVGISTRFTSYFTPFSNRKFIPIEIENRQRNCYISCRKEHISTLKSLIGWIEQKIPHWKEGKL